MVGYVRELWRDQEEREYMAAIAKSAVIGPNTLAGHQPEQSGEFATPRVDNEGNKFDSNASRVMIWFRTWAEAQEFVAALTRR